MQMVKDESNAHAIYVLLGIGLVIAICTSVYLYKENERLRKENLEVEVLRDRVRSLESDKLKAERVTKLENTPTNPTLPSSTVESSSPYSIPPSARAVSQPYVPAPSTYKTPADKPTVAENGDVKGWDNNGDGRAEPVYVRPHYRDGKYDEGQYRAAPSRK